MKLNRIAGIITIISNVIAVLAAFSGFLITPKTYIIQNIGIFFLSIGLFSLAFVEPNRSKQSKNLLITLGIIAFLCWVSALLIIIHSL